MDLGRQLERLAPATAEETYDRLTSYRFAQRYAEGKSVACISCEDVGYGTHLLAETGKSIVGFTNSSEALELASASYPAPNVIYRKVDLPELPYPDGHFDVVVAFEAIENLERPEDLVVEAKRVLKQDGILVISTPDKQAYSNDRNYKDPTHKREMYVSEFREMLEQHYGQVSMYRQGAVAGGLIFKAPGDLSAASVESTMFVPANPSFGAEPPTTHFVIAVCSDSEIPSRGNERSHLLLDRDRRIFDECDDRREDIQLLRDEIQQMQETEVQAFLDTVEVRDSEIADLTTEIADLRARLEHLRARLEHSKARTQDLKEHSEAQKQDLKSYGSQIQKLKSQTQKLKARSANLENHVRKLKARNANLENHVRNIESSRIWRMMRVYRRLRTRLSASRET